jgi:hypothetical protein
MLNSNDWQFNCLYSYGKEYIYIYSWHFPFDAFRVYRFNDQLDMLEDCWSFTLNDKAFDSVQSSVEEGFYERYPELIKDKEYIYKDL